MRRIPIREALLWRIRDKHAKRSGLPFFRSSASLLFPDISVIRHPRHIRQRPADGHRPPDSQHADARDGGKRIGKEHPRSQGNHRKHQRHGRPLNGPIQPVQQEEAADTDVKRPYHPKVGYADSQDFRLLRPDENQQEHSGKNDDYSRYTQSENHRSSDRAPDSFPDPVFFFAPWFWAMKVEKAFPKSCRGM